MENYGRTDTGELIGPYDTVDELNRELAASNSEREHETWCPTDSPCRRGLPCVECGGTCMTCTCDDSMAEGRKPMHGGRTFTCNECHTTGSLRWMETHDCQGVQDVNQFGGRCEDYPCCGHMDGECAPQERFTKEYWQDRMNDPDYDPDHDYGMNG